MHKIYSASVAAGYGQVRVEGCAWSRPFALEEEDTLHIVMRNETGQGTTVIRVVICNGVNQSRFQAVFRRAAVHAPYK